MYEFCEVEGLHGILIVTYLYIVLMMKYIFGSDEMWSIVKRNCGYEIVCIKITIKHLQSKFGA